MKKINLLKRGAAVLLSGCMLLTCMVGNDTISTTVNAEETEIQKVNMSAAKKYQLGDVNEDGLINLLDAQAALKAALAIIKLNSVQQKVADVNKDSKVDLRDAKMILNAAIGITVINEYVDISQETTEELALVIDGTNSYGSIITEEDEIVISGNVNGKEMPILLEYKYADGQNVEKERTATLNNNTWLTDKIPLSLGSNNVKFTLRGENGSSVQKEIVIYRSSTQIDVKNDVVVFDIENEEQLTDVKFISEELKAYTILDNGTESTEDDECELIVDETSPLYMYIKDGTIQPNEVVYIPANEYFPTGLTFRYVNMDDSCSSGKEFQPSSQEVIHGQIPSLTELLDGEGYMASDSINEENPIAFVCGPIGTDLNVGYTTGNRSYVMDYKSEFSYGDDSTVNGRGGFQFQNLKQFSLTNKAETDKDDGKFTGSINLGFDDVILYDEDGRSSTKEDRIVLDGSMRINNIKPVFGCEWSKGSSMPQQMISTVEYTENANVKATFGGKLMDKKDLMKGLNYEDTQLNDDLNSAELFAGIKASGVDLSNTIVIGAVGIQLSGIQVGTMRTIQNMSCLTKLNPVLALTLYVDVNGKLETTASIAYDYECYVKKGINVQNENYTGAFGTCEENNNGIVNSSIGNYQINIYDTRAKSKSELDEAPEEKITLSADGKTEAHNQFMFQASGNVEILQTDYEDTEDDMTGVFRIPHGKCTPGFRLSQYFNLLDFSKCKDSYEICIDLMHRLHQDFSYAPGATQVNTTAEEAWGLGRGVCQDYAHIYITLLRMAKIPARYVCGLIIGEGASHAWAEALCGDRWVAFDPTNACLALDHYIKLGHGRDAADCAINRGLMWNGGAQSQKISVLVEKCE